MNLKNSKRLNVEVETDLACEFKFGLLTNILLPPVPNVRAQNLNGFGP